ncbi:MAG: bifunctional 5,10-methylenetetrahydrofolate dehydrogenase/5,10-methenyltetrahydrofolate cyclohydrolase [Peptoniphilaceae bacterium]|nr:bifunctional 5,10-methylenetetrahydrofolate dehydrogenase/5,10-methenyltetrahydrofolate cyclohydrolase [Peptoniphilaceae bacterium]MDD7383529.1 bifunctional 5,10-methylenetetrahydrofolate dehydrogenase/5,10-methenyltetrahydrofolate cyclohydrolase [Peptoniphilaceae bacterium]MDY3738702.1 bifunctional 5,10-methylenetetrahydrofolate dehydrogenase/5,10-methenyltetrahydrofolate cyclohydrolase [Peptoniphilaceae bacterium]
MKVITSDSIKKKIIDEIKDLKTDKKLLIVSQGNDKSVRLYKKSIIRKCKEYNIECVDKNFSDDENHKDIINGIYDSDEYKKYGGYIILQPLSENTDIKYLRKNLKDIFDLDGFSFESLGKMMDKDFSSMPQTSRAVLKFIEEEGVDVRGKKVVIANSSNVIGKPLNIYLNGISATVTTIHRATPDKKEIVRDCDIFISAIGTANFFNEDYFTDDTLIIDVGVSYVGDDFYGDVDYDSLKSKNVSVVKSTQGVGSITTLCLIEKFLKENC